MRDWQQFVDEVTWFLGPGDIAVPGPADTWSRAPITGLPVLSRLLDAATVTPVSVNGRAYELLAWGSPDRRRGWLCMPPVSDRIEGVHATHQGLLAVCGGIVERFGEPESWWNNQNEPPRQVRRVDSLEGSLSWHDPRSTPRSCVSARCGW